MGGFKNIDTTSKCLDIFKNESLLKIMKSTFYFMLKALFVLKGTLMQIWKSTNIFFFIRKWYVENFTLKHLSLFEICTCEICEKFVYKHSEIIEYVKN